MIISACPVRSRRRRYTVAVGGGETFAFYRYTDRRLSASQGWLESDFFIAPTHMNCDKLVDGWTIAIIEAWAW